MVLLLPQDHSSACSHVQLANGTGSGPLTSHHSLVEWRCVRACMCAHESPTTWTLRPEDTLKSLDLPSTLFETRSLDLFGLCFVGLVLLCTMSG